MIRAARYGDIPQLVEVMQDAYGRSIYAGRGSVDVTEAKRLFFAAIQRTESRNANGTLFNVSESDGVVMGLFLGVLDRVYQIGSHLCAQDLFFYLSPGAPLFDHVRLVEAFMAWANDNPKVAEITLSRTGAFGEDHEALGRLYERNGLRRTGVIWQKEIER